MDVAENICFHILKWQGDAKACFSRRPFLKVFLSKQQTTDLSGKVQDLLFQKDAIERLGIYGLRAQLARTKAVRQKASVLAVIPRDIG